MNKVLLVILLCVGVFILVPLLMYVSYNNREVGLRNRAAAQQKNLEVVFDRTWKIISQIAQVADAGKEAFKEIYPALMEGRYGNARGGALMSWIQESNPQFDMKLYDKLAAAIESQRTDFAREQQKMLDIKREHDDLRLKFPSSFFVGSRPELTVIIVTSSKTDEAFRTGQEDDINLFQRDKPGKE